MSSHWRSLTVTQNIEQGDVVKLLNNFIGKALTRFVAEVFPEPQEGVNPRPLFDGRDMNSFVNDCERLGVL